MNPQIRASIGLSTRTGFLVGLMEPEKGDAEPEPDDEEGTEEDPN